MRRYMEHSECLMEFLERSLDDPLPQPCGKCVNCDPNSFLFARCDEEILRKAALFLRNEQHTVLPRKKWPMGNPLPSHGFSGRIPEELRFSEGRVLSLWGDSRLGRIVAEGKYTTGRFSDELVEACCEMIRLWKPEPAPQWVACVPSLSRPEPVPDFAERLAGALGIPFSTFAREKKVYKPCLLVDDMVDSRWTFTVLSALLRMNGVQAVHPLVLALTASGEA